MKNPVRTIHCRVCDAGISGYDFPARMKKLREHYRDAHPGKFKQMIKKAVRTRAQRRNPSGSTGLVKGLGGAKGLLLLGGAAFAAWWFFLRKKA